MVDDPTAYVRKLSDESARMQSHLLDKCRECESLRDRLHRQDSELRRLKEFALWILTPEAFGRSIQGRVLDMAHEALGDKKNEG